MKIKNLPKEFDLTDGVELVKEFRSKIVPNMTDEEKNALQQEYNKAVEKAKKERLKLIAEGSRQNAQAFLDNPKEVLEQIEAELPSWQKLGERILAYGIADVTMKRKGKGVLCHKGTIAESTLSNFAVTVKIGQKVYMYETSTYNDRYSKESEKAFFAKQACQDYLFLLSHPARTLSP